MPANPRAFALTFPNVFVAAQIEGPGQEIIGAVAVDVFNATRELTGEVLVAAEDALDRDVESSPGSGAFAWEALYIPNGTFTFDAPGYGDIDIQIHTVQRGSLVGRRVVKVRDDSGPGGWRAIAYVSRQGNFQLWTRYLSQAEEAHVIAARAVVEYLRTANSSGGTIQIPSRTISSVPVLATVAITRRACVIDNNPVHSPTIVVGRTATPNPGFCDDHIPEANAPRQRRVVPSVNRDAELQRLIDEEAEIDRQNPLAASQRPSRRRSEAVYGADTFTIRRTRALPLCQITGTEIQ